ncbi:tail fiber assembly protein [Pseudomonas sp. 382]|uniref:tail fiber assembly protein n=1 Tax=Pseudomonas sp. 382 TaxID=1751969 RepID=UPI000C19588B|nr:tail fiber assembly protein [Pseudomonas sp. 382]PIK75249.1 hypothetical protein CQW31_28030 [Pseudomonas sp. 382]
MPIYARIEDCRVMELLETDGDITQMFHPSLVWIEVPQDVPATQGWECVEGEFSAPAPIVPTDEELKAAALATRNRLLAAADEATAGMADAYIAGLLSAEDTETFKSFAAYKLALNKVDRQPGYPIDINWPDSP